MDAIYRNLGLDLVRVTEAAALAAARWMGRGNKEAADQAAVDAMRYALAQVDMDGIVVIGEGEKDEAPMLYIGERIGNGSSPEVDVAVDPIDGTRLLANGLPNAISVVALSPRNTMLRIPKEIVYMDKIAVGPEARGVIDILASPSENLHRIAEAMGSQISDITVVILDRPRHADLIRQVREVGARIRLISDGDVAGGVMAGMVEYSGINVLMGIGGAPEAVITAAALKCLGGDIQCQFWFRDDAERRAAIKAGFEPDQVFTMDDLIAGNDVFFAATGISDGELLRGVRYTPGGARTQSLVMRSRSGTVRWVDTKHNLNKLKEMFGADYRAD